MPAPASGTHGVGDEASLDADPTPQRLHDSAELEAAVEALRARVLDLAASEAIPEKAATSVAAALPGMPADATVENFGLATVAHLAAAFVDPEIHLRQWKK